MKHAPKYVLHRMAYSLRILRITSYVSVGMVYEAVLVCFHTAMIACQLALQGSIFSPVDEGLLFKK